MTSPQGTWHRSDVDPQHLTRWGPSASVLIISHGYKYSHDHMQQSR